MSEHITSIPVMLSKNRHHISKLAKDLNVNRTTIMKYENDIKCEHHIVVRGRLMTKTRGSVNG